MCTQRWMWKRCPNVINGERCPNPTRPISGFSNEYPLDDNIESCIEWCETVGTGDIEVQGSTACKYFKKSWSEGKGAMCKICSEYEEKRGLYEERSAQPSVEPEEFEYVIEGAEEDEDGHVVLKARSSEKVEHSQASEATSDTNSSQRTLSVIPERAYRKKRKAAAVSKGDSTTGALEKDPSGQPEHDGKGEKKARR